MNCRTMPEAIGAAGFMLYNYYFTECGNAVDRLTVTQRPSGSKALRNIWTAGRNQKFVFALDGGFADMAVISTVGVYGMSLP